MTHEPELTAPVDLCLPSGRLNPAAVGWTRHPLHNANLRGWGRTKRWEYWGIITPEHIIGVVASSLDYAGVHSLYVLDRATAVETSADAIVPLARNVVLPPQSGIGDASARGGGLEILISQQPTGTTIRASAPDIRLEVEVPLPPGHESLGVVVPWSDRRFQYTVKDIGRPVRGTLLLNGRVHEISEHDSFGVLDHGRGKWPYSITWNWAAGAAPGRGLQLGGKWTDGTAMTENGLFVDGRLHKIGSELRWHYDRSNWLRPWRIEGDRVQVSFHPFHDKVSRTNLGVIANETHQCFGHFSGWVRADDGSRVNVDGLVGWAEEARNRW